MPHLDSVWYWLSITSAILLSHGYNTSAAYERPIHTLVIALAACAFAIVSVSKAFPVLFGISKFKPVYTAVPLDDLEPNGSPTQRGPVITARPSHNGRVRLTVLVAAIVILSIRVELVRRIIRATECTRDSVEIFLPLIIAAYDCIRFQQHGTWQEQETPDSSVYDVIKARTKRYILLPRFRYLYPTALLCFGCKFLLDLWHPINSTYICPISTKERATVQLAQFGCLVLDSLLAFLLYENLPREDGNGLSPKRSVILWSSTMASSAVIWGVVGTFVYIFKPEYRHWLLLFDTTSFVGTVVSIAWQAFVFCIFCITTLHCIMTFGIISMTMALTIVLTALPSFGFMWSERNPYPSTPTWLVTCAAFFIYLGWYSFHTIRKALDVQENGPSWPKSTFFLLLLLLLPVWIKSNDMYFHPIDLLIYDADRSHGAYFNATTNDGSLVSAVQRYKERYKQNPPSGFDVWFEYAKNKSCLIIDEYDQIYEDLLPFATIQPSDIRRWTWEMVSNPWNEISGITIRDGVASVQENVIPTHRWMLEGVSILINSFATHLPDMDLAFNLNDESRVNVPFDDLQHRINRAKGAPLMGKSSFSANRKEGWLPVPKTVEEEFHESNFIGHSFRPTFAEFGSVGCPPSSSARRTEHIASRAHVCTTCAGPHSIGQFVSNWTLAASPCHQPDLSHLHGFYTSPAAFKASYRLFPVFSQSKPHGYNDILYPSAWNYMDKVQYAPSSPTTENPDVPFHPDFSFHLKHNTLFWRGATSEGMSSGEHAWRGMTRQRLVHLTNNLTSHPHDAQTVLLPHPTKEGQYQYRTISGSAIRNLNLDTDIKVVDHISRCGGIGLHDCIDQEAEFAPRFVQPSDFQDHWRYKFLFDLDGAGFSGRFLPFLQSNSLPFKTSLFREWWDSRVTAWKHFVPVDIRLHGVYSTLAYFAGVDGYIGGTVIQEEKKDEFGKIIQQRKVSGGKKIKWEAHEKEAEMIATEGRKWAGKVLRKEDMEVYFFRLLLEWGRMTDDRREELGFVVEG